MKEVLLTIGFTIFSIFLILMVVTLLISAVSAVSKTFATVFYGIQFFSISFWLAAFVLDGIASLLPFMNTTGDYILFVVCIIIGIWATKKLICIINMDSFHSKIVVKHIMNASFVILDTWLFYNYVAKRVVNPHTVWMNIASFFACIVLSYLVNRLANKGMSMRKDVY